MVTCSLYIYFCMPLFSVCYFLSILFTDAVLNFMQARVAERHFLDLRKKYGSVLAVDLVNKVHIFFSMACILWNTLWKLLYHTPCTAEYYICLITYCQKQIDVFLWTCAWMHMYLCKILCVQGCVYFLII